MPILFMVIKFLSSGDTVFNSFFLKGNWRELGTLLTFYTYALILALAFNVSGIVVTHPMGLTA